MPALVPAIAYENNTPGELMKIKPQRPRSAQRKISASIYQCEERSDEAISLHFTKKKRWHRVISQCSLSSQLLYSNKIN